MKKILVLLTCLCYGHSISAQTKSIEERLGYPKGTKLLIIHADDMGSSHSENVATIDVMEHGVVNSGSIMVPCPWFPEIAAWAKTHPDADLGLHLTLTSEWKTYKWGPVAPRDRVASLLDENGFLNETLKPLIQNGKADEVETELRSQIELALRNGIKPTHFDEHMAGAVATADFLKVVIKLGHEYKVPVLITREREKIFGIDVSLYTNENDVVLDRLYMAEGKDLEGGMDKYYTNVIKNLPAGLNCLLLHAAYDDAEEKALTAGYPYYNAPWRQTDTDYFKNPSTKKLISDNHIKMITWREVRDKLYK